MKTENIPAGIALMSAAVLLFSIMNVLVKTLSGGYPVNEVVFFRNAMALFPVVAMVAVQGGVRSLRTNRPFGHVWRGIIGLSAMSLLFWSFSLLPLAEAVSFSFSSPLFLTALSLPLLGERVGIHRWSAVVFGFAGVLIMVRPTGEVMNMGALVALSAAFFQALAMSMIRQLSKTESPNTIVFYFTLFTTVLCALSLPVSWEAPRSWTDLGLFAACGLTGGIAQLLMTRAYALAPAAVVAPFNYALIIWAALFDLILWGSVPGGHVMIGASLVAASGLYILYRETVRRRAVVQDTAAPASDTGTTT